LAGFYPTQEMLEKERSTGVKLNPDGSKCVEKPGDDPFECIFSPYEAQRSRDAAYVAFQQFGLKGLAVPSALGVLALLFAWIASGFRKSN
jgi:hypothetical protein